MESCTYIGSQNPPHIVLLLWPKIDRVPLLTMLKKTALFLNGGFPNYDDYNYDDEDDVVFLEDELTPL